jgi:hypothetical protein
VRTAVISDMHLGSISGEDVLHDAGIREVLFGEIAAAERLVLLGDAVELRDLPLAEALEATRPFFEELGEAMAGREIVYVPGNHDHRLAEPLLERRALASRPGLGLENRYRPAAGASARIARWLGPARLELAYPGIWLREDVYATHGHYMDCHLTLPRFECIAAAAVMRRTGPLPDPAQPEDYERVLRPVNGLTFGLAQSGTLRLSGAAVRPSEQAWRWIVGGDSRRRGRRLVAGAVAGAAVPATVWALNRILGSDFRPDLSARAISRGGVAGAIEMVRRLRIEAPHVITGHSHRMGPRQGEEPWSLPGGGSLHNTGNWIFASVLHGPGARPGPYWPGTVTWVEGEEAPRQVGLLAQRSAEELGEIARGGRFRLAALASRELG